MHVWPFELDEKEDGQPSLPTCLVSLTEGGRCSRGPACRRAAGPLGFRAATSPADHSRTQLHPQQGPGHLKSPICRGRLGFTSFHFPQALPTGVKPISLFPAWPSTVTCAPVTTSAVKGQKGAHPEDQRVTQLRSLSATFYSPQLQNKVSHILVVLHHPDLPLTGTNKISCSRSSASNSPKHTAAVCYRRCKAPWVNTAHLLISVHFETKPSIAVSHPEGTISLLFLDRFWCSVWAEPHQGHCTAPHFGASGQKDARRSWSSLTPPNLNSPSAGDFWGKIFL